MLANQHRAVNSNDVPVGESFLQLKACNFIQIRLIVRRIKYGTIDNQEIGIGGG